MITPHRPFDTLTELSPVPWTEPPCLNPVTDDSTARVSQVFVLLAYWCSFITMAVGVLALAGWFLNQPYLQNPLSGSAPVSNTGSLALLFLGASLLYSLKGLGDKKAATCAQITATVPILIGIAALTSFAGFFNLDFDQVLFRSAVDTSRGSAQIAPNVALSILASGLSLLSMGAPPVGRIRIFQHLAFIPLLISISALIGYTYKLPFFAFPDSFNNMQLPTAIAFLVLSLGILSSRPREGLMVVISNGDAGGLMARTLLPTAIGLPILFGWLRVAGESSGLVNAEAGSILLVISMITAFFWVVWRTCRQLGRLDMARRLAGAALHESADRTRSILDKATDAFVAIDKNGRILDWNPQAEKTFGWLRGEIVGRTLEETIIPKALVQAHKEGMARLNASGHSKFFNTRVEMVALHKEGHEFPVELASFPVGSEETGTVCAFLHDISERKAHEDEVNCLNKALLEQITEAGSKNDSLKLLTDELRTACERAIESSKTKSDFIASLSHEIRTPLSSVIGMAELILDTDLGDDQRKLANTLHSSAYNLLGIVNDILDLSKIEAKKLELNSESFDMRTLVEDVAEMLGTTARSKGLSLSTFVDPALPLILKGDSKRLRQILVNLCGNALKFTESGSVMIRVDKLSLADHAVTFSASVIDTGCGLAQEAKDCLFLPFSQARGKKGAQTAGTGLGLAISKSLVELMGGEIGVDSHEAEGSNFWFTATLHTDGVDYLGAQHGAPAHVEAETTRLIIVSNDRFTSESLTMYSYARGIECKAAGSIEETEWMIAKMAKKNDYPIRLFVDMSNRAIDPRNQIEKMYQSEFCDRIRWVALTHIDSKDYHRKLKDAGFAKVLVKPFRFSDFLHSVSNDFDQQVETREDLPALDAANAAALQLSTKTVLLVEDNPALRELATRQLKRLGVAVATASDGMEAVSNAAGQNYDLILMDCQMPVMDGFEATRQIRRIEERGHRHTPIVALTASVLPQDREKCFAAGMDEFLTKPVSLDDIRALIKRWMTEQKQPVKQFATMTNDEVAISDLIHSARFQVSEMDQLTVVPREITKADLQDDLAPTPVDMQWLDEQYGKEALSEILQTFTDEAESLMTLLKRAALAHDFIESARVAHQLAGIASVIGAKQMHAQSLNLEHASKETDTYRANVALDELQRAYEDVTQWIKNKV
ncbi:MAG: hypothetical protein C0507_05300 [Cyanobacteria bacterium PR.3.49]|nr:hypothetical protein [Cyanobacteria bacterium PR.3.49]